MRTWLGFLLLISAPPSTAFAASRDINPYLAQIPQSYDLISKPKEWEGEGMRGYEAKISVQGRVFDIVATCAVSVGENEWIPSPEVTVSYGDEMSVFDLSGPGDVNRELRLPLIKSEIIPHTFYVKTCQQRSGDDDVAEGLGQGQPEVSQSDDSQSRIAAAGQKAEKPVNVGSSVGSRSNSDIKINEKQDAVIDIYQKYLLAKMCLDGDISDIDLAPVKIRLREMDEALVGGGMDPDDLWKKASDSPLQEENNIVKFALSTAGVLGAGLDFEQKRKIETICEMLLSAINSTINDVLEAGDGEPRAGDGTKLFEKDF